MVREDEVLMSVKELGRLHVIHQIIEKKMTQGEGSGLLGVTDREASEGEWGRGAGASELREAVESVDR